MKMFNVKKIVGAVVACGLAMAYAAAPAQAAVQLKVTDLASGVLYDSGLIADSNNPIIASVSDMANGWLFLVSVGSHGLSSPPTPSVDLAIVAQSSGSGNYADIYYTQTGLTSSPVSFFGAVGPGVPFGTTTYSAWADATNTPFGTGTSLFSIPSPSTANYPLFQAAGPYSVTIRLHLDQILSATTYSSDASLQASQVPEPASLMLLGSGLVAFGRTIRRRMRKN